MFTERERKLEFSVKFETICQIWLKFILHPWLIHSGASRWTCVGQIRKALHTTLKHPPENPIKLMEHSITNNIMSGEITHYPFKQTPTFETCDPWSNKIWFLAVCLQPPAKTICFRLTLCWMEQYLAAVGDITVSHQCPWWHHRGLISTTMFSCPAKGWSFSFLEEFSDRLEMHVDLENPGELNWVIWWRGTKSAFRLCKCALYHHKSAKLESEAINKVCTVICRLHVE